MSTTNDFLCLRQNSFCQRMLSNYGDNDPEKEYVIHSSKIIKINRKGKEQNRILLLTDKALYNLKPNKMYTCQRRIEYSIIESISTSLISTEFTIHIPTQYDYRYKATSASDKNLILAVLSELCNVMTNKLDCFHTGNVTITKTEAKILSIDDRRKQIRQVSPPISHTPLVGSFYSRKTMSELNQTIKTPKLNSDINLEPELLIISPSFTESISSCSILKIDNDDLFTEYNIDNILKRINIKDEILVYGYIRKKAMRKYKLKIDSSIIDYCLLYLYAMLDAFEIMDIYNGNDCVKISQDKKILSVGKNNILNKIIYGCYNICNNPKTFMWKLRIKEITYDSIVYIGIGNEMDDAMVYKAGGIISNNEKFNICKYDRNIGSMLHMFEKGDYIDVILDLVDNMLVFLINCDTMHIIKNIVIEEDKEYKLAALLSKSSIALTDFMIFDGSWKEYEQSRNIKIKYNTKYFC